MKFHVLTCSGCDRKCHKVIPITFNLSALVSRLKKTNCSEKDKIEQKIPLKVVGKSYEVKQNEPCICSSGKKFKKCCMKHVI